MNIFDATMEETATLKVKASYYNLGHIIWAREAPVSRRLCL